MANERKAIRFATFGAGILAVIKLSFGIFTGSMVLIASAVDSLLDLMVSLFNLLALREAKKPADKEHNYGHGKIEAIAGMVEGLIVAASGVFIIISSIKKLSFGTEINSLELGIGAMLISLFITGLIVFYLSKTAKTTKNLIVRSDLMHYKMDFLTNIGVILALVLVKFTGMTLIDPLIAIGIAIYILFGCWELLREGFDLLMDKSLGKDEEIGKLILSHDEVASFHKLKTHQSGGRAFISFHMVFKNPDISLKAAHEISYAVETALKKRFRRASVIVRLDPFEDL